MNIFFLITVFSNLDVSGAGEHGPDAAGDGDGRAEPGEHDGGLAAGLDHRLPGQLPVADDGDLDAGGRVLERVPVDVVDLGLVQDRLDVLTEALLKDCVIIEKTFNT